MISISRSDSDEAATCRGGFAAELRAEFANGGLRAFLVERAYPESIAVRVDAVAALADVRV